MKSLRNLLDKAISNREKLLEDKKKKLIEEERILKEQKEKDLMNTRKIVSELENLITFNNLKEIKISIIDFNYIKISYQSDASVDYCYVIYNIDLNSNNDIFVMESSIHPNVSPFVEACFTLKKRANIGNFCEIVLKSFIERVSNQIKQVEAEEE